MYPLVFRVPTVSQIDQRVETIDLVQSSPRSSSKKRISDKSTTPEKKTASRTGFSVILQGFVLRRTNTNLDFNSFG